MLIFRRRVRSTHLLFWPLPIDGVTVTRMDLSRIRPYAHKHCRFKLRSGKEVFGVIWEVEAGDEHKLFFASVGTGIFVHHRR
mgnify:CR=1 FL=1